MVIQGKPRSKAFTLIELLVVVIIIGILAATALPNFIGAQMKAKLAQVKANMHTCQLCSEAYATDTAGIYSTSFASLAAYYPGGGNSPGSSAGTYPMNPFNGQPDTPTTTSEVSNIEVARTCPTGSLSIATSGNVCYDTGMQTTVPTSYAIWGGDNNGLSVSGEAGKQLILSNP